MLKMIQNIRGPFCWRVPQALTQIIDDPPTQRRIQDFWKGGPGKEAKPRTERRRRELRRGGSSENFEKLDAIFCNLAYIFGIRMASDIIQNGAFAEQETVAATISIHTPTHTVPPILPKLLGFRPL